jgi:hypothetical protein
MFHKINKTPFNYPYNILAECLSKYCSPRRRFYRKFHQYEKFDELDLNNFCYICGKYCQQLQRRNFTDFVKQAYEAYFFQIYNRLNHQRCTVKICQCGYLLPYQTFPMMMLKCYTLESQNRSESEFEGCNPTL